MTGVKSISDSSSLRSSGARGKPLAIIQLQLLGQEHFECCCMLKHIRRCFSPALIHRYKNEINLLPGGGPLMVSPVLIGDT